MYNPNNLIDNKEQFIRDNLSFLNESDDELSENSENTSARFQSYEEFNNVYGTSPISSKVNETWSSISSGSIISSRETPSRYSSNNSWTSPLNHFCKNEWYSPLSIEDLYFGQNFASNNRDFLTRCSDRYIDTSLYKIWNTQASFPLNQATPYDANRQFERLYNSYTNLGCKMWPYTNFPASNFDERANTNYLNPYFHSSFPFGSNLNNPSPTFSYQQFPGFNRHIDEQKLNLGNNFGALFPAALPAEEVLNRYFTGQNNVERRKHCSSSDSNSLGKDFTFPIGRTSTPINSPPNEKKPIVAVEQRNTPSLPTSNAPRTVEKESDIEQPSGAAQVVKNETKPDFKQTEAKTTKPEQNDRSVKHFDFCKFCYKNGELSSVYMSHVTKSPDGSIACPILRKYVCDICGATGSKAHTRKYCPRNTEPNLKQPVFRRLTNGVLTSSYNHK